MGTSADLYTLWSVVCETAYTDAPLPRPHRPPSFRAAVYNNNNNMIVSDGRTGIMTRVRQFSTAADNTTCCNAARVYNIIMHMYILAVICVVDTATYIYVVAAATSVIFVFL